MSASVAAQIKIAIGQFAPLLLTGLTSFLGANDRAQVVASDLDDDNLERHVTGPDRVHVVIVNPASAQRSLHALRRHSAAVVVLAESPTPQYGRLMLSLATTCVAQSAPLAAILAAVLLAAEGEPLFVAEDGTRWDRAILTGGLLTKRELDVLFQISKGNSYGQVASELGITPETVRTYTIKLRQKLGAERRQGLVGIPVPKPGNHLVIYAKRVHLSVIPETRPDRE